MVTSWQVGKHITIMKNRWSKNWGTSVQARKQRKFIFNAPAHIKRKLLASPLSKTLRKEHNKRSLVVRKGDTVKVLRGQFKGKMGKITDINAKKTRIYVDGAHQVKANGQTSAYPIHPSNVVIITPVLSDKKRKEALARK